MTLAEDAWVRSNYCILRGPKRDSTLGIYTFAAGEDMFFQYSKCVDMPNVVILNMRHPRSYDAQLANGIQLTSSPE